MVGRHAMASSVAVRAAVTARHAAMVRRAKAVVVREMASAVVRVKDVAAMASATALHATPISPTRLTLTSPTAKNLRVKSPRATRPFKLSLAPGPMRVSTQPSMGPGPLFRLSQAEFYAVFAGWFARASQPAFCCRLKSR
jgi:hypothetical protein